MDNTTTILTPDFMKKNVSLPTGETFGQRLAKFRQAKGFTQAELGKKVGLSPRMVAYYETETEHPPTNYLPAFAKVLKVTIDELLGFKITKEDLKPKNPKLWKKLRKVDKLSTKDQKLLINYLDRLLRDIE